MGGRKRELICLSSLQSSLLQGFVICRHLKLGLRVLYMLWCVLHADYLYIMLHILIYITTHPIFGTNFKK